MIKVAFPVLCGVLNAAVLTVGPLAAPVPVAVFFGVLVAVVVASQIY